MTEEHKRKISEAMKGKKKEPLHKVRIAAGVHKYWSKKHLEKRLEDEKLAQELHDAIEN